MSLDLERISFDHLEDEEENNESNDGINNSAANDVDFTPRRIERIKSSYMELHSEVSAIILNAERPKRRPRDEEDLNLQSIYGNSNDDDSEKLKVRSRGSRSMSGGKENRMRRRASSKSIPIDSTPVESGPIPTESLTSLFTILTSTASLGGLFSANGADNSSTIRTFCSFDFR
jgi:hypothetical protein